MAYSCFYETKAGFPIASETRLYELFMRVDDFADTGFGQTVFIRQFIDCGAPVIPLQDKDVAVVKQMPAARQLAPGQAFFNFLRDIQEFAGQMFLDCDKQLRRKYVLSVPVLQI